MREALTIATADGPRRCLVHRPPGGAGPLPAFVLLHGAGGTAAWTLDETGLDATADRGPANLTVTTVEGPLRIAGKGSFAPPSQLNFSGEARGDGPNAGALEPLLNLIGPRRADGSRAIELRSR